MFSICTGNFISRVVTKSTQSNHKARENPRTVVGEDSGDGVEAEATDNASGSTVQFMGCLHGVVRGPGGWFAVERRKMKIGRRLWIIIRVNVVV